MRIIQSNDPRPLNLLAVGPSGLVAASSDTPNVSLDVEVWEAATGTRRLVHASHSGIRRSLAFTPDGNYLLIGEQQAVVVAYAVRTGARVEGPSVTLNMPAFALSGDGTRMLVTSSVGFNSLVECLSLESGLKARQLWVDRPPLTATITTPAISLDGAMVAHAERSSTASGHASLRAVIRVAETGRVQKSIPLDPTGPARQLAFTADGAKLLVRTDSNKVRLLDATTGAVAGELTNKGRPYVTGIAVHPKGPVACARTNGTVTLWDVEKREPSRTLDWKAGRLVSVAFSPDGSLAACGTEEGKIVVWDVDL